MAKINFVGYLVSMSSKIKVDSTARAAITATTTKEE